MRLFRREPLHRRLARTGGLDENPREDQRMSWDKAGVHGVHRLREWDVVVTTEADLDGTVARFVVLNGEIVIEEGPDDVEALADAVELEPAFRAEAQRVADRLWSVGARRIEVVELPGQDGERLELVSRDGFNELTVDEQRVFGSIPLLERQGDYVVRARRLDGDRWEVEAAVL